MDRRLTLAKELAQTDETRARIELVEAEFRYLRSVASVYHVFRAYQAAPSRPLFDALEEQAANYQQTWDSLHPDGKAINPGGYRKLRTPFGTGWPTNRPLLKIAGPPFNWDFEKIRGSGRLPRPVIPPRIRGGQLLKPYDGSARRAGSRAGAVEIDPETGAPEDQ